MSPICRVPPPAPLSVPFTHPEPPPSARPRRPPRPPSRAGLSASASHAMPHSICTRAAAACLVMALAFCIPTSAAAGTTPGTSAPASALCAFQMQAPVGFFTGHLIRHLKGVRDFGTMRRRVRCQEQAWAQPGVPRVSVRRNSQEMRSWKGVHLPSHYMRAIAMPRAAIARSLNPPTFHHDARRSAQPVPAPCAFV